jgi:hypothetical protein
LVALSMSVVHRATPMGLMLNDRPRLRDPP